MIQRLLSWGLVIESRYDELRHIALDQAADGTQRSAAVQQLGESRTREAAEALIELGTRPGEGELLLRAAGAGLAQIQAGGVSVSEWDLRDLTASAADAFFK